jgi:signal peptidase I
MTDAAGPVEPAHASLQRKPNGMLKFLRDLLIIFVAALLVSFLVKTFLIRSFYIPSGSMMNTLMVNDRVVVNELTPKITPLHRGDVIVFKDPGGWLANESPTTEQSTNPLMAGFKQALSSVGLASQDGNNHLIKRVIGLPGDKIECCNSLGQLSVNGVPLDEPYINVPAGKPSDAYEYSVTVPKNKLWVLGDNRYYSEDSAAHNAAGDPVVFVPEDDVVGRAFVLSWPVSRWTTLSDYPDVFKGTSK